MTQKLLSILVPVYNEQAYLARIIERVIQAPVGANLQKEIILVNDASTDNTKEVIQKLVARYPNIIRAFEQPQNQGKGAAIRRAIQEMKGDIAIIQDADLEYDPNEYAIVLRPILEGYADVVYGSRFLTREMRKVLFYHHKLGNMFLTHLSNWMTGLDLTDMETCYKAFRGEILKTIPLRSNRFGMEPELTAKIAKRGLNVYEVPISYHGRRYSEGKKIGWKDGFSAIKTIITYWLIDDCYTDSVDNPNLLHSMEQSRNFTRYIAKKGTSFYGQRILELESGLGNLSKYLPQKEHLTLTTQSDFNYKILRNSYDGNAVVDIQKIDYNTTPLCCPSNKEQYDTVFLANQLEHIDDDEYFLRETSSFLAPKGHLLLVVPRENSSRSPWGTYGGYRRRYTQKEITDKLQKTGYKVEKCQAFNSLGTLIWNWNRLRHHPSNKPFGRFSLKFFDTFLIFGEIFRWMIPGANFFIVAKKL